ncbi:MAG: DUF5602 domain-containing protein [Actinomycetota bacterium]|nr:DUF5602 domain-containing protein [Actinomycetota bacterium]
MHSHYMRRYVGPILSTCVILTLLAGCGNGQTSKGGTFFGPPQSIGDGTTKTYVTLDDSGKPTEVGIRMSAASLDGLPAEDAVPPRMLMLDLPKQASSTVFDHLMLNWNSHGHEPTVLFGKPHFDMHFYMVDSAAVAKIDPSSPDFAAQAAHLPDAKYVPAGYVPPPGPAAESAVPDMGLHWTDSTEGIVPGKYDFTQILINGSWDGTYTFIEPMMTREWMLTKQAIQENIKQPQAYQRSGYFPTTYSVHYDNQAKEYSISLGGMMMRQAS